MAFPMPLVIPQKSVRFGNDRATRQTLPMEIVAQTKADLHSMLVGITREDTAQQIALGNDPQLVEVDSHTNKPLDEAKMRIVVLFGVQLARAAMGMVEAELRGAISRSTTSISGKLVNVSASWQWRYIPKGGIARTLTAGSAPPAFGRGDKLVLVPVGVPYATAVNRAVRHSGRIKAAERGRKKGSTSTQNVGFLSKAATALKRRNEFKQFKVIAEFTERHAIPGEVYSFTRGGPRATGVITIRPRFRRVKV
ncbi:MAG TPA: hypothetical protein VN680_02490 [Burkholderiaceae bacterium]|nr:hypothetical protein [Burkholderiaceae bacterium]